VEELDLRQVLRIARRRWWLFLLLPILLGVAAHFAESRRGVNGPSFYTSTATLLINPSQSKNLPAFRGVTYSQLAVTQAVLAPVISDLHLAFTVDQLRDMIVASPAIDPAAPSAPTEIFTVSVTDNNAQRAAAIANGVANSFVNYIATQAVSLMAPYRDALTAQIANAKQQIADMQQQIQTLQHGSNAGDPATVIQISSLQTQLSSLQQSYAQLLETAQSTDLDIASVKAEMMVVEQAEPPAAPNAASSSLSLPLVPIAVIVGLLIAVFVVVLIEYFDDTIKRTTDFPALTGAGLLSVIPRIRWLRSKDAQLFTRARPDSPASEAIRLLRTKLEVTEGRSPAKRLAVSGLDHGDGATTVVANLGVSMARAGLRTVLIDANLRTPDLHRLFDIGNETGLASLLAEPCPTWLSAAAEAPGVPNLVVIPSGPVPPHPADLLSQRRFSDLLDAIAADSDAIVIDTPPILVASDALVVDSVADGVVLVCRSGQTRVDVLHQVAEMLHGSAGRLLGTVINKQRRSA
jgi:capsular exopolysaccharide synthesis family protein